MPNEQLLEFGQLSSQISLPLIPEGHFASLYLLQQTQLGVCFIAELGTF